MSADPATWPVVATTNDMVAFDADVDDMGDWLEARELELDREVFRQGGESRFDWTDWKPDTFEPDGQPVPVKMHQRRYNALFDGDPSEPPSTAGERRYFLQHEIIEPTWARELEEEAEAKQDAADAARWPNI